jgi:hypothetical protein
MKKTIFWIGVAILVIGIVMFTYSYSTIENIKASVGYHTFATYFLLYPEIKQQWDLANILQPIGLGMLVLGAIMLAYGLWVKE